MNQYLPKRTMRRNAARIVELADTFGHCHIHASQTVEEVLNLSIPCARLVAAGIVTQVVDTFDGVNDGAVADVERYCRRAVELLTAAHGSGWWTQAAQNLLASEGRAA